MSVFPINNPRPAARRLASPGMVFDQAGRGLSIRRAMMAKSYTEKLKDPRWQKRRLEVLEAAGWACSECGVSDKTLHVHHGCYRKWADPWDYEDEQLHVLCVDCHSKCEVEKAAMEDSISRLYPSEYREVRAYVDAMNSENYLDGQMELDCHDACQGTADRFRVDCEALVRLAMKESEENGSCIVSTDQIKAIGASDRSGGV